MSDASQRRRKRVAQLAQLETEAARLRKELAAEAPASSGTEQHPALALTERADAEGTCSTLALEAEGAAQLGSWAVDLRTDETSWSEGIYRILGLDRAQLAPSTAAFLQLVHPDDRELVRRAGREASRTRSRALAPIDVRVVRPDGEVRRVRAEAAALHDAQGEVVLLVGTLLDLTERRRAAELLSHTLDELNEAQRIAGLASWRRDAASGRVQWSSGMYRLLDVPETSTASDELLYEHIHFDDQESVRKLYDPTRVETANGALECRIVQANGRMRWVLMRVVRSFDARGVLVSVQGVLQDITERKALEEQLRQSQKMEAVGTLAGGVAHDFNNYLMVIAGYTQLLSEQLAPGDPSHESVEAISEAYQRCAHLTQQLLSLSRKRKAHAVTLDLSAVIVQLAPLVRSLLGELIQLRLALEPEGMWITADPLQIEQALTNLVVNARDAMPDGGELVIRVEPYSEPGNPEARVRLSVVDVGCGIPTDLRSRIFEPFFTTKQVGQGTGLGLSTVYAIVRNSGGKIAVDSELGLGTAFHIDWPRAKPPQAVLPKPSVPPETELPEKRSVLLVEDVARVRELLVLQLQRAGYHVRSAANGVAALELLAREHFDLVLSDMVMPQMGGLQLAEELQKHYPDVRCLLMTGYAPDALHAQDKLPEPASVLRKPFSNDDLLRAVRRSLATRRG